MAIKRQYPQLPNIKDHATKESLKMNWDKTFEQADALEALRASISSINSTLNDIQTRLAKLERDIVQALIKSGE